MPKYKKQKMAINRAAEVTSQKEFSNYNILSATTAVFTQELLQTIIDLQNRLVVLENRLANYESHTHSYTDDTITDTDDGTGETVTTTKTTTGVVQ